MNLANKLTIIRLFLVPFACAVLLFPYNYFNIEVISFFVGNVKISLINIVALLIFALASFTDFLDGYIARKNNLVTTFGKFLDPIADKLLVNCLLIILGAKSLIPIIPVIVMISRDTLVDGMRMIAVEKNVVVAAGFLGKLKTVFQMFAIILLLANNLPFELVNLPVADYLLWAAMVTSVVSGLDYFYKLKDIILESY